VSARSSRRTAAVALVAVLGLAACTSDPSPKRVAEDLVRTEASSPEEEECMLDVIDDYDDEFGINDLGSDANSDNPEISGPAQAALEDFEADLAACRT